MSWHAGLKGNKLAKSQVIVDNYNIAECLEPYDKHKSFMSNSICYTFKDERQVERTLGEFHLKNFIGMNVSMGIRFISPLISSFSSSLFFFVVQWIGNRSKENLLVYPFIWSFYAQSSSDSIRWRLFMLRLLAC